MRAIYYPSTQVIHQNPPLEISVKSIVRVSLKSPTRSQSISQNQKTDFLPYPLTGGFALVTRQPALTGMGL